MVLVVVGMVGAWHAVQLEHRLNSVVPTLERAEAEAKAGQLADARASLATAQVSLASANSTLYDSPDFELLQLVPVARQNLEAVKAGVRLGLEMIDGGEQIFTAAEPLESSSGHLSIPLSGGQVPLATLERVNEAITSVTDSLPAAPIAPHGRLIFSRLRSALRNVYGQDAVRRHQLVAVGQGISLLDELAGANGPRRYLIAVANTAEMRGSGGMILSYGVLQSDNGVLSLGQFGPIDDLALHQPADASFPSDFMATYGALGPNEFWRNANMMSDFTQVGPVLDSMYTKATGLAVNGVIQIDPAGLAAILTATGPVDVAPLGQITAANVVAVVLNQAYVQFPDRTTRQDYLQTVARDAFSTLVNTKVSGLSTFSAAFSKAVSARHIVLYDASPAIEANVKGLHADGGLPGPGVDFAQLTVQNFGGDKMDYYLQSSVTISGARPTDSVADLTATISLRDDASPTGRPPYIFGPFNGDGDIPGTYRGLVTLYLPFGSYLQRSEPGSFVSTPPRQGTQNRITAVTYSVVIPPGGASLVVLHVQLPPPSPTSSRFQWVPSPRINPTVELFKAP